MNELVEETTRLVYYLRMFYNQEIVLKQFELIQAHIILHGLTHAKHVFDKMMALTTLGYDIQFTWLIALNKSQIVRNVMDVNSLLGKEYIISRLDDIYEADMVLKNDQKAVSQFITKLMEQYIERKKWFSDEENMVIHNAFIKLQSIIYDPSLNEVIYNDAVSDLNRFQLKQIKKITYKIFRYLILAEGEKRQHAKTSLEYQISKNVRTDIKRLNT